MCVKGSEAMRVSDFNPIRCIKTINLIRKASRLSPAVFADRLETTSKKLQRILESGDIPMWLTAKIAVEFNLSIENVLSGSVDFKQLSAAATGSTDAPERYLNAAYSRIRTSTALLDQMEQQFGWEARDTILRHLQVPEAIIQNRPDDMINIQFVSDICEYVGRRKNPDSILVNAGLSSIHRDYSTALVSWLRQFKSFGEALSLCADMLAAKFERNHAYRLERIGNGVAVLSVKCQKHVCDELGVNKFGNVKACLYRSGTIGALASSFGVPLEAAKKTACIHTGDKECRYEIRVSDSWRLLH